jgi:hypothetical protein
MPSRWAHCRDRGGWCPWRGMINGTPAPSHATRYTPPIRLACSRVKAWTGTIRITKTGRTRGIQRICSSTRRSCRGIGVTSACIDRMPRAIRSVLVGIVQRPSRRSTTRRRRSGSRSRATTYRSTWATTLAFLVVSSRLPTFPASCAGIASLRTGSTRQRILPVCITIHTTSRRP